MKYHTEHVHEIVRNVRTILDTKCFVEDEQMFGFYVPAANLLYITIVCGYLDTKALRETLGRHAHVDYGSSFSYAREYKINILINAYMRGKGESIR